MQEAKRYEQEMHNLGTFAVFVWCLGRRRTGRCAMLGSDSTGARESAVSDAEYMATSSRRQTMTESRRMSRPFVLAFA